MSSLKILESFRIPTNKQSFLLPFAHSGVPYLRKRSRSPCFRHPLLRGHHDLQVIQNHVAPSYGPPARVLSPLFFQAKSLLLPKPRGKKPNILKLHGPNFHQSCVVPPKKAHFLFLPQSVIPASILVFFQLYWAAIVSLGRCGPMAWSQSSSSSHTGAVTRESCLPVTSWVEVTPIPLAQSVATAI